MQASSNVSKLRHVLCITPLAAYFIAGRIHTVIVIFCSCEPQTVTLLKLGFWPSSPVKPAIGYSTDLLDFYYFLMLEAAVSASAFVKALKWKNNLSDYQVV